MGTMSWGIDAVMAEAEYRVEELGKTRIRTSPSARRRGRAGVPAVNVTEIAGRTGGGAESPAARTPEGASRWAS